MIELAATYSPEDNKLRLYASSRLDSSTYERVKAAGFSWAPKQGLFYAPMWTPFREDLLLDLCGEIGDEDTTLVDRAQERAERFCDYSSSRAGEAERARSAVAAITEGIPFGQPILVGHHSERRARRDAERIESVMRKAVNLWETSQYWRDRAAGALRNAKYKERVDVRARRIKKLEAEKRIHERERDEAIKHLTWWTEEGLSKDKAIALARVCHLSMPRKEGDRPDFSTAQSAYGALTDAHPTLYAPRSLEEVIQAAKEAYPKAIARAERWIDHYENRLAYERAMLDEQGGLLADKVDLQPGGRVLVRGEWSTIVRVNKREGKIVSVTTNARYVPVRSVDEITDYQVPTKDSAAAAAAAVAKAPTANYDGEGFAHITKAQYKGVPSDYKGYKDIAASDKFAAHRVRRISAAFLSPDQRKGRQSYQHVFVFLVDEKRKDPPARTSEAAPAPALPMAECADFVSPVRQAVQSNEFDQLREQLRDGVQVVTAPQVFPTPPELAARMIDELMLFDGARVLEPSAGTGSLVRAMRDTGKSLHIVAVEISPQLAGSLCRRFPNGTQDVPQEVEVITADFLASLSIGTFDAIAMNPPFVDGQDIRHIRRAVELLAEGGRLVAICANGPHQNKELRPMIEAAGGTWEPLPSGTFKTSGTLVNTVLLTYQKR